MSAINPFSEFADNSAVRLHTSNNSNPLHKQYHWIIQKEEVESQGLYKKLKIYKVGVLNKSNNNK